MSRYLDRKKYGKHGQTSEKIAMKKLGARRVPGSGCMDTAKSDGYDLKFQYENKSTIHKSFSVTLNVLKKIRKEARDVGRIPALCVSFVTGSGESVRGGDFVVIDRATFEEMKENCMEKMI